MTVVIWMDRCPFCKTGHYTDQKCKGDTEIIMRLWGGSSKGIIKGRI